MVNIKQNLFLINTKIIPLVNQHVTLLFFLEVLTEKQTQGKCKIFRQAFEMPVVSAAIAAPDCNLNPPKIGLLIIFIKRQNQDLKHCLEAGMIGLVKCGWRCQSIFPMFNINSPRHYHYSLDVISLRKQSVKNTRSPLNTKPYVYGKGF